MAVKVVGIYLAAGQSKRMGQNKLALPWMGKALGSYGLRAAIQSQMEHIIVVLNAEMNSEWAGQWITHKKVCPVVCAQTNEGQAASIRCGLKEASRFKATGVIIQLADQPFVNQEVLDGLINRFAAASHEKQIVNYIGYNVEQMIRPPILFGNSVFQSLLKLKGDQGARKWLKEGRMKGIHLEWPNAFPFMDVDTWEAYQEMIKNE